MIVLDSRGRVVLRVHLVSVLLDQHGMSLCRDVIRIHTWNEGGHVLRLPKQINEGSDVVSKTTDVSLNDDKLPEGFLQRLVILVTDTFRVPALLLDLEELQYMHS